MQVSQVQDSGKRAVVQGEGFAIVAALLWGINYPLVKLVLGFVPENDFLIIRFSLATILFVVYLIISGETFRIARKDFSRVLMLGILGVGVYNIIWTSGIHRTTAANAAIMISASPIFTGIYSLLTGDEKISLSKWLGTIMAFAGICAIIYWTPGSEISLESRVFAGNILVLLGSLLFSMYAVLAKPLLKHYSPVKLTTLAMVLGLPVILIYSLSEPHTVTLSYGLMIWSGFAYIIVLGTMIAFIFWYKGVQQTSPFKTVIFHYIVPVVSMITGSIFLGEPINIERVLGGILVFAGLLAVKWDRAVIEKKANLKQ